MQYAAWKGSELQYVNPDMDCQSAWKKRFDRVLDTLLPMQCLLCGQPCREICICRPCVEGLPGNPNACHTCGLPQESSRDSVCGACLARRPAFDRVHAPLLYEFPVDRLIHLLKFRRNLAAGRALALIMMEHLPTADGSPPPILVPVPLHWSRSLGRGYNQSTELGWHIARWTGFKLTDGKLVRRRRTRAQAGLDAESRRRNLRKAFRWNGPPLKGMKVVLIDDVMTTGTTARECARVLRKAGAESVEAWVAARAIH